MAVVAVSIFATFGYCPNRRDCSHSAPLYGRQGDHPSVIEFDLTHLWSPAGSPLWLSARSLSAGGNFPNPCGRLRASVSALINGPLRSQQSSIPPGSCQSTHGLHCTVNVARLVRNVRRTFLWRHVVGQRTRKARGDWWLLSAETRPRLVHKYASGTRSRKPDGQLRLGRRRVLRSSHMDSKEVVPYLEKVSWT